MTLTNDAAERKLVSHLNARASEVEIQFTLDDVRGDANPKESAGGTPNSSAKPTKSRLPVLAAAAVVALIVGGGLAWFGSGFDKTTGTDQEVQSSEESELPNITDDGLQGSIDYDQTGERRAEQAELLLASMSAYLDERINEVIDWSETAEVRAAAAAEYPQAASVEGQSVEEIEAVFQTQDAGPVLDGSGSSSVFLADLIEGRFVDGSNPVVPIYGEVFFTDSNGYVVGATGLTTDFVQSDELWWTTAWEDGFFLQPVAFDESAGVKAISVAVRIEDDAGQPIGVLKALVDASAFQVFADNVAVDGVDVLVTDINGLVWAHTSSEHELVGLDPSMTPILSNVEAKSFNAAKDRPDSSGFERDEATIIGYANTLPSTNVMILNLDYGLYPRFALIIDDTELSGGAVPAAPDPASDPDSPDYETFVPAVIGLTTEEATSALEVAGFSVSVTVEYNDNVPENRVMGQSPDPGDGPIPLTTVEIVVSQGPTPIEVPDLAGQELAVANGLLENAGFIDYISQDENSALVESGLVIRSEPAAGEMAATDEKITVFVSAGPTTVLVPNVVGQPQDDAESALEQEELVVIVGEDIDLPAGDPNIGNVVDMQPKPGTEILQGQPVTIRIGRSG